MSSKPIPILMYHSISEDVSNEFRLFSLSPQMFRAHLQYLKDHSYTPMTVTQFVSAISENKPSLPERPVVITIDDGFEDFYTGAVPILADFNFPSTLYITTQYIGQTSRWLHKLGEGDRPMMTWAQIDELGGANVECGAHTHTHPQLDTLSLADAREEITRSKAVLEDHFGQPVLSFAYPHGYHGARVRQAVIDAGFTSCCAVKHAMSSTRDDPFALARLIVTVDTDVEQLSHLLSGKDLPIAPMPEEIRTKIWRLVRRTKKVFNFRSTAD